MSDYIIAMDNGTSSNGVALFGPNDLVRYEKLPIKKQLSYTKEEHFITRVDAPKFRTLIQSWNLPKEGVSVVMERIMINPLRFRASISAARCLEAELVVLEEFGWPISYEDSKAWQHALLVNVVGSKDLKKASLALGKKLFPQFKLKGDADSLLLGYWAKHGAVKKKNKLED